jgi:hypothetical protein
MIVTLGDSGVTEAFEINHLEGNRVILKDEPGLRMEGERTTEIFFPRRHFTGVNRFTILTRVSAE